MPSSQPLSYEKKLQIYEFCQQNPKMSARKVAEALGVHNVTVLQYRKVRPVQPDTQAGKPLASESDERNGDERTVTRIVNKRIKTLAELAAACEIDTSEWEIYKWRCVAWQTGMKDDSGDKPRAFYSQQFSVSATMRLKQDVVNAKNEIEELRKKAEHYAPKYIPFIHRGPLVKSGNMVELSIVDHHFAGLIWGKETGHADWDLPIAERAWNLGLEELIDRTVHFKPESMMLVVGNDQLNSDNRAGTTERGTPQRNDSRYQKGFATSRDVTIAGVERLLTVARKVVVMAVPGNHDPTSTWHLGESLRIWFRNNPNVIVRNEPTARKYTQWGVNMLMHTHGNAKKKLDDYGRVMAAEQPQMWGATKWREAHTADKHQRRLIEFEAYAVRILPSLRPPCDWSSEEMLIGAIRAAEGYAWNNEAGLIGTACHSILDVQK